MKGLLLLLFVSFSFSFPTLISAELKNNVLKYKTMERDDFFNNVVSYLKERSQIGITNLCASASATGPCPLSYNKLNPKDVVIAWKELYDVYVRYNEATKEIYWDWDIIK